MTIFKTFASDRRFITLIIIAAISLILGFGVLTADQSMRAIIYGGYWAMLIISSMFAWSMWRISKEDWRGLAALRAAPRWPAALILGCGALLLVHEAYGFKVLMDEVMLLGTSMTMHFEKVALVPMRGHNITGAFELLGGELDKRPLFQPFLVSLLHDFTGYRPENCFALNTILTFVLLALGYKTGHRVAGRGAGAVVVLLLTSLPLLAQNATGGGFEILNLVMVLATLLLGMRYVEKRDTLSLNALILSAVLLANTRYESVLFLLPVGLLIGWVWWQRKRPLLSWTACLSPLLLLPYALHNHVFSARPTAWEMASQPGYTTPFSASYLPDNVGHALNFFFNTTGEHSNSITISVLGFIALPFFCLWSYQALRKLASATPGKAALAIFSLGFAAHTLLLLCYFWGKFDDPVIRRLSLPLNLFLVIAIIAVTSEFNKIGRRWWILATITGAGMFAFSLPSMARHSYSMDYYVARETEWRREFIAEHPEKDYLVIDNNSIIWITHLVSGTPIIQAIERKNSIIFNQQNRIFSAIYVFQRYTVDPTTGALSLPKEDDLGPDFHLETVSERRFTPLKASRISRVVSIDAGPNKPVSPSIPLVQRSPAEAEKIRKAYLDNVLKNLP